MKPKEFWIAPKYVGDAWSSALIAVDDLQKLELYVEKVHVIEKSAYDRAIEAIKSALYSANAALEREPENWHHIIHSHVKHDLESVLEELEQDIESCAGGEK